jgi:hypothetical protein
MIRDAQPQRRNDFRTGAVVLQTIRPADSNHVTMLTRVNQCQLQYPRYTAAQKQLGRRASTTTWPSRRLSQSTRWDAAIIIDTDKLDAGDDTAKATDNV